MPGSVFKQLAWHLNVWNAYLQAEINAYATDRKRIEAGGNIPPKCWHSPLPLLRERDGEGDSVLRGKTEFKTQVAQ